MWNLLWVVAAVLVALWALGLATSYTFGGLIYGLLILAFARSHLLWLSYILLFFTGAALMMVFSTVTSLVQLIAPNEMRGRVMSIYMVAFRGGMPLGSLAAGYAASRTSAPLVLVVNGILIFCVAAYFAIKSHGVREL